MKSLNDALRIGFDETGQRLKLAESLLIDPMGVVVIANSVALLSCPTKIACEVIYREEEAQEPKQYSAVIIHAKEWLKCSTIWPALKKRTLEWELVADTGMGRVKLWPHS